MSRCTYQDCTETKDVKPFMALGFICAEHREKLRRSLGEYLTGKMGEGYTVTVTTHEDDPEATP